MKRKIEQDELHDYLERAGFWQPFPEFPEEPPPPPQPANDDYARRHSLIPDSGKYASNPRKLQKEYAAGKEARKAGVRRNRNPHDEGSLSAELWDEGWVEGVKRKRKSQHRQSTQKVRNMKTRSGQLPSARMAFHEFDNVRSECDRQAGTARKFYRRFSRIVRQAAKDGILELLVVLYCRVSGPKQYRAGNSDHQLAYLRQQVRRIGRQYGVTIKIVGEYGEDESGWKLWKSGRPELVKAAKLARKHSAVLVALNTSRLVRNRHHARGVMPTVDDFEQLMALVGKVTLATVLDPDHHEDRGADSKRGHSARGAKPGRPKMTRAGDKKRRRMSFKLPVIRAFKQGLGNREIARELSLAEKTVRDWRRRYWKYWGASFLVKQR